MIKMFDLFIYYIVYRTLLPVVLAQLLIQFHDLPITSTSSDSFLNDTNQLQLNRSVRYAIEQDANQFRSIENLPSQDDSLQFDELIYGNSGNEINSFFFDLNFTFKQHDNSPTENQT